MNRRDFLKSLFAAGVATAINVDKAIEQCLIETVNMSDVDFVAYVSYLVSFHISNPGQTMIITDIGEE